MSIAENEQMSEKSIDEIFNKGILEKVSGFVTSDFIYHVRGEEF
jgi:hypothetical protein